MKMEVSPLKYRGDIDGLRALAVVVLHHLEISLFWWLCWS
jgi:hypothetical protein